MCTSWDDLNRNKYIYLSKKTSGFSACGTTFMSVLPMNDFTKTPLDSTSMGD
jgi:hypothetical protein